MLEALPPDSGVVHPPGRRSLQVRLETSGARLDLNSFFRFDVRP